MDRQSEPIEGSVRWSWLTAPVSVSIPRFVAVGLGMLLLVAAIGVLSVIARGPGSATAHAQRYLAALSGGDPATAWSLLTERARTIWGSRAAFDRAVASSDWSSFEYAVVGSVCDDGVCAVDLHLPNGVDSVPSMLHEGPTHYWWGDADSLAFTDQFITGATEIARQRGETSARIVVIYGRLPWDDSGIG